MLSLEQGDPSKLYFKADVCDHCRLPLGAIEPRTSTATEADSRNPAVNRRRSRAEAGPCLAMAAQSTQRAIHLIAGQSVLFHEKRGYGRPRSPHDHASNVVRCSLLHSDSNPREGYVRVTNESQWSSRLRPIQRTLIDAQWLSRKQVKTVSKKACVLYHSQDWIFLAAWAKSGYSQSTSVVHRITLCPP